MAWGELEHGLLLANLPQWEGCRGWHGTARHGMA